MHFCALYCTYIIYVCIYPMLFFAIVMGVRFLVWLDKRIEDCEDLEERVGLKSLQDIIKQV